MSRSLRSSLSLALCTSLVASSVAQAAPPPPPPPPPSGSATATADQPPDPNAVSAEERLKWAKKLFTEARAAHDAEDFFNSVIKFEQAYSFAPDKHIFAFNIGQDAWELRDCARVKQYLELFIIKETANQELLKTAREILAMWDQWDIAPTQQAAFYCGTGWRASEAFFYAWLMDWKRISVYDGGWFEWSSDPANPVTRRAARPTPALLQSNPAPQSPLT